MSVAVARARDLVGVRFRLHGRDRQGLDCVGLAALVYGRAVPSGYGLRSGDAARLRAGMAAAGLVACDEAVAGDLLLCRAGPGQLHLAIWTGDGIVHADAGLRRVVERPGVVPWPVVGVFGERVDPGGGEDEIVARAIHSSTI